MSRTARSKQTHPPELTLARDIPADQHGPVWWPLREMLSIKANPRLRGVAALWCLIVVLSMVTGALNVTQNWSGVPLDILGVDFAVTIYPPFVLSVLLVIWLGPAWGALPIYLANVVSGLVSGMGLWMSQVFGVGGVIETLMLWGSLVVLRVHPDLRRPRDLFWFSATALVAAVTGSLAAILWNSSHALDPSQAQRVWRGWVIGDFAQIQLVALPVLHFFGPAARRWVDHRFVTPPGREFSYTHGVALIVIAFALLGLVVFLGVHQALGSIELAIDARTVDGELLLPKLREIILMMALLSTALILATGMFSTALARLGERQRHEARRDALTGCLNRRTFPDLLAGEAERSRRLGMGLAVLFVDVDRFKQVNDRLGHAAGDQVLVEVAERIEGALRANDLMFRWGGEEFVVVLPHTAPAEAAPVAERIRAAVAEKKMLADGVGGGISTSVSVGVAATSAPAEEAPSLLEAADRRCLAAKTLGRNRVVLEG
jgi:diguanylate cyclase (GGDEF)-like protein